MHAVFLNKEEMEQQDGRGDCWKDGNVETIEPRQSRSSHVVSATQKTNKKMADERNNTGHLSTDLGCKECQSVPRQQVPTETECQRQKEKDHAARPRDFSRRAISLEEIHAEHVHKQHCDHQVRRPAMERAHQPTKAHVSHDELHTFECRFGAGTVIQEQQNAGRYLNRKKKEGHAAEVIPDGVSVNGNGLMGRKGSNCLQPKPLVQPYRETVSIVIHRLHRLDTTTSSPERFTSYCSRGRGGGPAILIPFKSK